MFSYLFLTHSFYFCIKFVRSNLNGFYMFQFYFFFVFFLRFLKPLFHDFLCTFVIGKRFKFSYSNLFFLASKPNLTTCFWNSLSIMDVFLTFLIIIFFCRNIICPFRHLCIYFIRLFSSFFLLIGFYIKRGTVFKASTKWSVLYIVWIGF